MNFLIKGLYAIRPTVAIVNHWSIVRGYKMGGPNGCLKNTLIFHVWQRNYHEHSMRKEQSYLKRNTL